MKNTIKLLTLGLLTSVSALAQKFEGVVSYSQTIDPAKMMANMPNRPGGNNQGGNRGMGQMADNMRKPTFFVLFAKANEFTYKPGKGNEGEEVSFTVNNETRSFRRPTPKNEENYNLQTNKFTRFEEYAQQPFNISGDFTKPKWKVDPTKTKEILGYETMKATLVETETRNMPSWDAEGKMSFKDSTINTTITAWFTDQLESEAGPGKYFGLPGLILEIEKSNGVTISATQIDKNSVKDEDLKVNSKGKKMDEAKFDKMKKDHQEEQRKNFRGGSHGGGMVIMRGN